MFINSFDVYVDYNHCKTCRMNKLNHSEDETQRFPFLNIPMMYFGGVLYAPNLFLFTLNISNVERRAIPCKYVYNFVRSFIWFAWKIIWYCNGRQIGTCSLKKFLNLLYLETLFQIRHQTMKGNGNIRRIQMLKYSYDKNWYLWQTD